MTVEEVALGIQIIVIGLLLLSVCIFPMIFSFWKEKFKK